MVSAARLFFKMYFQKIRHIREMNITATSSVTRHDKIYKLRAYLMPVTDKIFVWMK
jgi:hypothetical protein